MRYEDAVASLCEVAHSVGSSGMVVGSGGNVSVRGDDWILISGRGASLGTLSPEDCVLVPLDEAAEAPTGSPSSELRLHRRIYTDHDAGAIVHTHSTYAVVMSSLEDTLPAVHYAAALLGGEIRVGRYERFGTPELAAVTSEALTGRKGALMRNHGSVAIGSDPGDALGAAESLEWLARLAYLSRAAGGGSTIDAAELALVADRSRNWAVIGR